MTGVGLPCNKISTPLTPKDIAERTSEYVQQQAELHTSYSSMPGLEPANDNMMYTSPHPDRTLVSRPTPPDDDPSIYPDENPKPLSPLLKYTCKDSCTPKDGTPETLSSKHQCSDAKPQNTASGNQSQAPVVNDFAKYLARRELVNTGLTEYDDRPESFRAWQSSFTNATKDLGLTASEELDLLVKWLGKESSQHVRRIRAVHINEPRAALKKVWERLRECYASSEVIESSLFKKLDSFPRISGRDYVKLRELGDLLMEVQSAKEDGYFPGLAYLDAARGVNPIVEKLPHGLRERWITKGSRYKNDYDMCFPPFSFSEFICYEAKTRNDPSFAFSSSGGTTRSEKPTMRNISTRTPIIVHKTDVFTVTDSNAKTSAQKDDGAGKSCPIYRKPHPIRKCRGFRAKTIDERKAYLRENGIFFKCCSSSSHLAKDCKIAVKCNECDSDRHSSAMHPGPAPGHRRSSPLHTTAPPAVSSQCTEVYSKGLTARSCSKICLVKVYPQNRPESAVKMYAILDDQSNRSLARSEFFDLFSIHGSPSLYSLKTCAGVTEMTGRKADGFQIEAVNGGVRLVLPLLIECNEILNNRTEILTPEAAFHHPHLKSVAAHIPVLDPGAQILLLLGRDILRVHKVRQQINGPHNAPFAQRLDLGWVLIGEVCLGDAHKPNG